MTGIKVIPNEVLEIIREFVGNCRLWQGELIMTLDKQSDIFTKIEKLLLYNVTFGRLFFGKHENKNNWKYRIYWITNVRWFKCRQWRSLEWYYNHRTNNLTVKYERKKIKWKKKDPLKKNICVEYVIS